ncbi:DUF6036 family nucleotidyltransferase [Calothrix rhizosoleniae]|uniref:DUF6036 family nucleotidyltransferase n=1 Tax=Calothrix rhizosoleniae TaxID=888997 RepID=UPI000B4A30C5|nr:DUF6036 family nucleotidyltransferase [Calothrix rhizosoleniae]
MPYIQTPFSQAIFKMFENLDSYLEKNYHNLASEAVKVYLFGGCAIHLHIGTRASNDVDADLQLIQRLNSVDILQYGIKAVSFDDEEGDYCTLDFDGNFNPTIAPIHPEYKERSSLIHATKSKLVSLYLVSAVDIAVSKLGRFVYIDQEDIINLFQNKMFTIEDFIETAEEAKKYCGVATDKLEFNIKTAIVLLKEEAQ